MRLPDGYRRVSTARGPIGLRPALPLLPIIDSVIFPRAPTVVRALRGSSAALLRELVADADGDAVIGVVAQRIPTQWPAMPEDLFDIGCVARLLAMRDHGSHVDALLVGGPLFRIVELETTGATTVASVEPVAVPESGRIAADEGRDAILGEVAGAILYAELGERTSAADLVDSVRHPADLASICLYALMLPIAEQQDLLLARPEARLARAVAELVTGRRAAELREEILTLAVQGRLKKPSLVLSP